ncbi:MAG: hypothetical protein RMJ66_01785 [Bacteroidia bacterium]|nr:hypothetical protein [Bacteroidia bacterium]MDW8133776.1 hypothetical protein [Bacteroidia bacterium]
MGACIAEASWLAYLSIFLMSGFKFMVGVGMSLAMGLGFWEQFITTTSGGIVGVWFFTYLGDRVRAWIARRRKRMTTSTLPSRWAYLWEKYGLWGVAFLTPPILSPPIGTAIAIAFGSSRLRIAWRMSLSMILWGLLFASAWQSLLSLWSRL